MCVRVGEGGVTVGGSGGVRDPGDTVMTRSKAEPSVPGSQEAVRLTTADNL